jgi:hypothetical protein
MNAPVRNIQKITPRVDLLDAFTERAGARAYLWAIGEYEMAEAVDQLQYDAKRDGLIERIGQDAVQQILADAFAPYQQIERYCDAPGPPPAHTAEGQELKRAAKIAPKEAVASTVDALHYELCTHGIAQLENSNCRRRLADLSTEQLRNLIAALERMRPKYPVITDDLLSKLDPQK